MKFMLVLLLLFFVFIAPISILAQENHKNFIQQLISNNENIKMPKPVPHFTYIEKGGTKVMGTLYDFSKTLGFDLIIEKDSYYLSRAYIAIRDPKLILQRFGGERGFAQKLSTLNKKYFHIFVTTTRFSNPIKDRLGDIAEQLVKLGNTADDLARKTDLLQEAARLSYQRELAGFIKNEAIGGINRYAKYIHGEDLLTFFAKSLSERTSVLMPERLLEEFGIKLPKNIIEQVSREGEKMLMGLENIEGAVIEKGGAAAGKGALTEKDALFRQTLKKFRESPAARLARVGEVIIDNTTRPVILGRFPMGQTAPEIGRIAGVEVVGGRGAGTIISRGAGPLITVGTVVAEYGRFAPEMEAEKLTAIPSIASVKALSCPEINYVFHQAQRRSSITAGDKEAKIAFQIEMIKTINEVTNSANREQYQNFSCYSDDEETRKIITKNLQELMIRAGEEARQRLTQKWYKPWTWGYTPSTPSPTSE